MIKNEIENSSNYYRAKTCVQVGIIINDILKVFPDLDVYCL